MTERNAAVGAEAARARFEGLFRDHHVAVVAYVRRRAPQDAVDDIVGETFLVAWRRLDCVPGEELPWLLAVARNVRGAHTLRVFCGTAALSCPQVPSARARTSGTARHRASRHEILCVICVRWTLAKSSTRHVSTPSSTL